MDRFDPYHEWLGIEPHEQPPDHYRLLGLARYESDPDAILRAADQRMKLVRGFQTGPRGRHTQELLNRLSAAKLCLLDVAARVRYDQQLRQADLPPPAALSPVPPPAPPPVPPPAPPPRATGSLPYGPAAPPVAAPSRQPLPAAGAGSGSGSGSSSGATARRTSSWAGLVVTLALVALALLLAVFLAIRSRSGGWSTGNPELAASPAAAPLAGNSRGSTSGASPVPSAGLPTVRPSLGGPVLVVQEANGDINLTPATAVLHGEPLRLESAGQGDEIRGWTLENRAEWHFRLVRPGAFLLEMRYLLEPGGEGAQVELLVDDRPVKVRTLSFSSVAGATGSEAAEVSDQFYVAILRSGPHRLSVRMISPAGEQLMGLREIRLLARTTTPADQ